MNAAMMIYNSYFPQTYAANARESGRAAQTSDTFQAQMKEAVQKAQKKEYPSAVEDWKKRNPKSAGLVDGQVRSGKKVLQRNGAEDVDRDSMTMEEYKRFFTELMDSIPYEASQKRDVNVWSITEKGWEQMKNDPDYEAWVLGYTAQDRAIHNPWAAMPGCTPHYHTERFGASIDEHLGQSFPMGSSGEEDEDETENWWLKRHKVMQELLADQLEKAGLEGAAKNISDKRLAV